MKKRKTTGLNKTSINYIIALIPEILLAGVDINHNEWVNFDST